MIELTILMPCLNEAEGLLFCINNAKKWIKESGVKTEILIADNGSIDGSINIAKKNGARVISVKKKGYGSALYFGCKSAKGKYIIMGDADGSYDFSKLDLFYSSLKSGSDLVIGNRFRGGIKNGAMPWKNRYIGNPVLSFIGRLLFNSSIKDFHCGLRGLTKEAFKLTDLRTNEMEFASEMIIKACILKLKISEVPTTLSKDKRTRPPHLKPWRDGWRHLRFMLLFSPKWLFIYPGIFLLVISTYLYSSLMLGQIKIGDIYFDINTLFFIESGLILSILIILMGLFINILGIREGFFKPNHLVNAIQEKNILEFGSIAGCFMIITGLKIGLDLVEKWSTLGFGPINNSNFIKIVSLSSGSILIGGIIIIWSLIIGFLNIPARR